MRAVLALLLLAATATPTPVAAAQDEDSQTVCLAVAHTWRGDNADIRRIREIPVPESFRRPFNAGGCTRFQLVEASLVDWHLAFGDEASVAAALAFLAADHLAGAPAPDAYGRALAAAWRAAERDLRAASPREGAGYDWSRFEAALRRSRPVARLRPLIAAHGRYLFLAQHYLRAAEYRGSPALFERARAYFVPVRDAAGLMSAPAGPDGFPGLEIRNALNFRQDHPGEERDLEHRLSIMAARLSRAPADIDAAQARLDAAFSPVLREAADKAERQRDFCDNGEGDGLDAIRAICREENDFLRRFTRFWQSQAQLDMLMASDPVHYVERPRGPPLASSGSSFVRRAAGQAGAERAQPWLESVADAFDIIERARIEGIPTGAIFGGPHDAAIALHLARADMYVRLAETALSHDDGREANDRAADSLGGALSDLVVASRLASAPDAPARFRQIAGRFLALVVRYEAARAAATEDRYAPHSGHARQAAFFRAVLAGLDRIAVGDAPAR